MCVYSLCLRCAHFIACACILLYIYIHLHRAKSVYMFCSNLQQLLFEAEQLKAGTASSTIADVTARVQLC